MPLVSSGSPSLPPIDIPRIQQPKATVLPARRKSHLILKSAAFLWALILAGASLTSYYILWPKVSIEPYASVDTSDPFAQYFSVRNDSAYSLFDLHPRCMLNFSGGGGRFGIGNITLGASSDDIAKLESNRATSFKCSLAVTARSYDTLEVSPRVDYRLPLLGLNLCTSQRFSGIKGTKGNFIWTYHGSEPCKATSAGK